MHDGHDAILPSYSPLPWFSANRGRGLGPTSAFKFGAAARKSHCDTGTRRWASAKAVKPCLLVFSWKLGSSTSVVAPRRQIATLQRDIINYQSVRAHPAWNWKRRGSCRASPFRTYRKANKLGSERTGAQARFDARLESKCHQFVWHYSGSPSMNEHDGWGLV